MPEAYFWVAACLACLLVLAVMSSTIGLFLVRRLARLARLQEAAEQRLVQLAYELRRLEQRVVDDRRESASPGSLPPAASPIAPLISVPDLAVGPEPADYAALAEKHADVWSLIEQGLSPQEIAQKTKRPIGQVELIFGLHRQQQASQPQGRHDAP